MHCSLYVVLRIGDDPSSPLRVKGNIAFLPEASKSIKPSRKHEVVE